MARIFKTSFSERNGEVVATYLHNKLSPGIGKIGAVFVSKPKPPYTPAVI